MALFRGKKVNLQLLRLFTDSHSLLGPLKPVLSVNFTEKMFSQNMFITFVFQNGHTHELTHHVLVGTSRNPVDRVVAAHDGVSTGVHALAESRQERGSEVMCGHVGVETESVHRRQAEVEI